MTERLHVYLFDEGSSNLRDLLGGKGADLAEMIRLGLPIPLGITVTTEVCNYYNSHSNKFPEGMEQEVLSKLKTLESRTGRLFGDPKNPLLLSIRSGAPISMPGMMDTVLNLGLNDQTVKGLIALTSNDRFAYDCFRRFVQMFGNVVLGVSGDKFESIIQRHKDELKVKLDVDLDTKTLVAIVQEFKELIKQEKQQPFPDDPFAQLWMAIAAVFRSWNGKRAKIYRQANNIPDTLGTAVNIQSMVFGNIGSDSGTGVCFTRNPSTGEPVLYGEFLMNAQGEDVVAGIRTPQPISQLAQELPHDYRRLVGVCALLEHHFKDMQDVEFTVENGTLYILQTRSGKRTAQAAIRIAVDMVREGLINKNQSLLRIQPTQIEQLLHRQIDPNFKAKPLATGLPASPGASTGKVIFDTDEAHRLGSSGIDVILVREETTPEDIHGMIAASGVLTSRGGMTSHAAVVARGMGKPAVVGCDEITIDATNELLVSGNVTVRKNEIITIDGTTGNVLLGEVPTVEPALSDDARLLLSWADSVRRLKVRSNADTPEGAAMARTLGAEGIGLCRTERMFNAQDRLPIVQEMILSANDAERSLALEKLRPLQKGDFLQIFRKMHGLPVTIRLLDLPLHEFLPKYDDLVTKISALKANGGQTKSLNAEERMLRKVMTLMEHNPMLGHRGCRLAISHPEIYEMQTRAILEAAIELEKEGLKIHPEIMLPLIGNVNEVKFLRDKIAAVADSVMENTGLKITYEVGTMIEVPRAAVTAGEIAQYADFFSFGTNDLTQTTFAFSRDDAEAKFMKEYLEHKILAANPFEVLDRRGVGRLMRIAVEEGRGANRKLKIGICGEHGGEPSSVEFCHQLGLDYVSCSPYRVPVARLVAAQCLLHEKPIASGENR
ncbi:MAG TPA: pyruvate, phosphate dikinase [Candidatus Bathyarchaeia archaeon]|nr:pyruvate, phosphate dikinase [Candidatus Bathyarchaeia archaeon]